MPRFLFFATVILLVPSFIFAADPIFPYGAVYFRKSNPPEQDWERDHKTAAQIGMNTFRHWFMWSAIEVAPGKYDWRDYDRMMDLAAQNGMKVVIAELVTAAPEWLFAKYPGARFQGSDRSIVDSNISGSSATGGFPGLCLVQQGDATHYAQSARGAYQAFFDSNIQADWVHLDDIGDYKALYLPYPLMLKEATAEKLRQYVERGGCLISEGLPAYFGDGGRAGTVQPNLGLDKLFGAKESYVEFTPDLLEDLTLKVRGSQIFGRFFRQEYTPSGGTPAGTYEDGSAAAIENRFGKGKTLLVGSYPGAGYYLHRSPQSRTFFAGLLEWASIEQQVRSSDSEIKARLHEGAGGTYLWVVNLARASRGAEILLSTKFGPFKTATDLWQGQKVLLEGRSVKVTVSDRDAAVIRLR